MYSFKIGRFGLINLVAQLIHINVFFIFSTYPVFKVNTGFNDEHHDKQVFLLF